MKKVMLLGAVVSALVFGGGFAFSQDKAMDEEALKATSTLTDQEFVKKIGQVNQAEIRLGRLAGRRADTQAVKDLGRRLKEDHMKADDMLRGLSKKKGWEVPLDPSREQNALYDRLDILNQKDFDREFTSAVVKDHEKMIPIVEDFGKNGNDADLKAYANEILPNLKRHAETAKNLEKKISG
jgi:putative membrane protein